jgi:carboxyl-terminal processing protease
MDQQPSKITVFFPIMLAVMLAAGVYIGSRIGGGEQSKDLRKLVEVLNYIEGNYVDDIDREELINRAIENLLQNLDPHSVYINPEQLKASEEDMSGNFGGVGIRFMILRDTLMVTNVVKDGPSENAGMRQGDRIVEVNGKTIAGTGISNQDVMTLLKGNFGTKVKLAVARPGSDNLERFNITRGLIPINSVITAQMIDETTGYIKLNRFSRKTYTEFKTAIRSLKEKGMKQLIFDLRNNPGGFLDMAINTADEFLETGKLIVYTEGNTQKKKNYWSTPKGQLKSARVAVLIDQGSASASEIVAGALQDNDRGIIIGRRSFGKGLVQRQAPILQDGSSFRLTIARYYTPTGRCIQKPYGDGIDYYRDDSRSETGELLSADSISFPDSLKKITPGGKVVYGGGGIMPDVFLPLDTAGSSYYWSELNYGRAFVRFAFDYVTENRKTIKAFPSFHAFKAQFEVSDAVLEQFLAYSTEMGIEVDERGLRHSNARIRNKIKGEISRSIWDENGYYSIQLELDADVQRALIELNKVSGTSIF